MKTAQTTCTSADAQNKMESTVRGVELTKYTPLDVLLYRNSDRSIFNCHLFILKSGDSQTSLDPINHYN